MLKELFKNNKFIFVFAFVVEFLLYFLFEYLPLGGEYLVPDVGVAPILGMMLGPFGALGQAFASFVWELYLGLDPIASLIDFTIMFFIAIVAYKLWYTTFTKKTIDTPRFNSTFNIIKFLIIIVIISIIYWGLIHISLESYPHLSVIYPLSNIINRTSYAFNMFYSSIIIGIFFISIFNIKGLPMKTPTNKFNLINIDNKYFVLSFLALLCYVALVQIYKIDNDITDNIFFAVAVITGILFCFTKLEDNIEVRTSKYTIIEKIILFFLIVLAIMSVILFEDIHLLTTIFTHDLNISNLNHFIELITLTFGSALMMFLCIIHIYFIEKSITNPIYALIDSIDQYVTKKRTNTADNFRSAFKKYLKNNDDISQLIKSFISLNDNIRTNLKNIEKTTAENEQIETAFKIASNIQSGMLKTNFDEFSNGRPFEIYGFMQPAKEVGGDFYDYFDMDKENIAFVIGDVSGKGVPATLFMVKTMHLIENHSKFDPDLEKLFENVNNLSCMRNDEDLFVTSLFGKLNLNSGKLKLVNAGHNIPLVKKNNEDFKFLEIPTNFVLGVIENNLYEEYEIELTPGDMVFLYTDGVTEANNDYNGFYGEDRLLKTINAHKDEKLEKIIENIKNDLYQFCDYDNQFDDITMLIIKYNGCESYE